MLSAYLDDALDGDSKAAFETRLTNEPALSEMLSALRGTDDTLRAAYDSPVHEPVPQRFLDLLEAGPAASNIVAVAAHRDIQPVAANDNPKRWRWIGGAVAACAAIALIVTTQIPRSGADVGDMTAFNTALDKTPSLQMASLGGGKSLTPQLSFASRDGGYCRQFSINDAKASQDGLACRDSAGWKVKALVAGSAVSAETGGFATASGASNPTIDKAIAALRTGDPLDGATEQLMINNGWSRKR